jgi:hypothetical protein
MIYSIGSIGDFSFETAIQNYMNNGTLCEVHIFDFGDYLKGMPKHLNMHYHQWRLKTSEDGKLEGEPKTGETLYSLAESVHLLGHDDRDSIDLFKIDCEGCEWDSVQDWMDPSIPRIMQIQVELHGAKLAPVRFFDTLMKDNGYVIFHKEPNTLGCGGECIEYSFLKLDTSFFKQDEV